MTPATAARALVAPVASSVQRMAAVDAMDPAWRALVNDYGYEIVRSILTDDAERGEATTPAEAEDALMVYRETRQQALLSTAHGLSKPRSAKAIAEATIRRAAAKRRPAARPRYVEADALPSGAHLFNDLGL